MKSAGTRIKALREKSGWSQLELAEKVGINNSVLSRIEANKRPVESELLAKFAVELDCSTDYLVGITKEPHQSLTDGEREFMDNVFDLTDEDLKEKFDFRYGGMEIPDELKDTMIDLMRTLLERQPHLRASKK